MLSLAPMKLRHPSYYVKLLVLTNKPAYAPPVTHVQLLLLLKKKKKKKQDATNNSFSGRTLIETFCYFAFCRADFPPFFVYPDDPSKSTIVTK